VKGARACVGGPEARYCTDGDDRKKNRADASQSSEGTVVYRGIKIAPMSGKRSATARSIRDALRTKSEQLRGESARG
jgi:hypothetical protein